MKMKLVAVLLACVGLVACGGPTQGLTAAELLCLQEGRAWDSGPVKNGWVRLVGPTGGITQVPQGACEAQWAAMGWKEGE